MPVTLSQHHLHMLFARDEQSSQLPALLLPWKPPLRCRCAQQRPSQAGSAAASACAVSGAINYITGFNLWRGVHLRAQLALLPTLVPPLRPSASTP